MKQTHQSVALAGLLALALAVSGCASMRGGESSKGASGGSGSTSSGHGSGHANDATGTPPGSAGGAGAPATTRMPETQGIQDGTGSSGGSGISGSTGSGSSGMQDDRGGSAAAAGAPAGAAPNSTVLAIEIVPSSAGATESDTAIGSSGAAGATGSSGSGASYRVTLRLDDGSTQVVTHGSTPDFRSGDRVNVTGGAIVR